jgi:hypothetical protein
VVPYTKAGAKLGYLLAAAETEEIVVQALDLAQQRLVIDVSDLDLIRSDL